MSSRLEKDLISHKSVLNHAKRPINTVSKQQRLESLSHIPTATRSASFKKGLFVSLRDFSLVASFLTIFAFYRLLPFKLSAALHLLIYL